MPFLSRSKSDLDLKGVAGLLAMLWMPIAAIYGHTFVATIPGFGFPLMAGAALLGVWAAMSDRPALPLGLCFALYLVLLILWREELMSALSQGELWSIVLVGGDVLLAVAAVVTGLGRRRSA